MQFLLSGLIGALIASILSILYLYFAEQIRYRRDIFVEVVSLSDDVYGYLQILQAHKDMTYKQGTSYLDDDEKKRMNEDLKKHLISSKIRAKIALVYGEGDELRRFNALQGELLSIARILWAAKEDTWEADNRRILNGFSTVIEPIRASVEFRLLCGTRLSSVLFDLPKKVKNNL